MFGSLPKKSFTSAELLEFWLIHQQESLRSFRFVLSFASLRPLFCRVPANAQRLLHRVIQTLHGLFHRKMFRSRCISSYIWQINFSFLHAESSCFAFSAASLSLCNAILSAAKIYTMVLFKLIDNIINKNISISSPPRCVSPFVDFTSMTPSLTSKIEISKVPPPKSNTAIVPFFFLSKP